MELTGGNGRRRKSAGSSRLEIVERAEAYMRAHLDTPVRFSKLCHIVGLSERGLRNAFYDVRGMSPKRCLVVERLQDVRRALTDSTARPMTVTSIATFYGFYELGRFAAAYKAAFGEAPSETLRCTSRKDGDGTPVTDERVRSCSHQLAKQP